MLRRLQGPKYSSCKLSKKVISITSYLVGKNAVSAIEKEVLSSKFLLPEIPEGDTYPSWDGEILVYSLEESRNQRSKSNIVGRVPVQVKGNYVDKFSEKERKFPIEVADLINYSNDSGVLFLLVEMTDMVDNHQTRIFYAELLVTDIQRLIKDKEHQKTISHTFQELPNERLTTICKHFLHHRRRQGYEVVEYDKNMIYSKYIFTIIGTGEADLNFHLFDSGTYIYGVDEQRNIEVPIAKFKADLKIEKVDFTIGTKDKDYYNYFYREISKDDIIVKFGKGFTLKPSEGKRFNIQFTEAGSIKERIIDCDFLLNIAKDNKLYLDKSKIALNISDSQRKEIRGTLPQYISNLREVLNVFNQLGVDPKVDFDELKKQNHQIKLLIDIAKKQVPEEIVKTYERFLKVSIADYNFLFVKGSLGKNKIIFNIFDYEELKENYRIVVDSKETLENAVEHSPYVSIRPSELLTFDNLNVKSIEKSLLEVDYTEDIAKTVTNYFFLDILEYLDNKKSGKKQDILNMVIQVYDCIIDKDPSVVFFINKMQTIFRLRNFTIEEISLIIEYKNQHLKDDFMACAFNILLENKTEFNYYFNRLSDEEKENFVMFPIYNLMKCDL